MQEVKGWLATIKTTNDRQVIMIDEDLDRLKERVDKYIFAREILIEEVILIEDEAVTEGAAPARVGRGRKSSI